MYCTNERAFREECPDEVQQVSRLLEPWFEPHMVSSMTTLDKTETRSESSSGCSRFCNSEDISFSIHMPCECTAGRRKLTEPTSDSVSRTVLRSRILDEERYVSVGPLEGPIQIFQAFTASLPSGPCKELFQSVSCTMTFVSKYSSEIVILDDIDEVVDNGGFSNQDEKNAYASDEMSNDDNEGEDEPFLQANDEAADEGEDEPFLKGDHEPFLSESTTPAPAPGTKNEGDSHIKTVYGPNGKPIDPITGEELTDDSAVIDDFVDKEMDLP